MRLICINCPKGCELEVSVDGDKVTGINKVVMGKTPYQGERVKE